MAAAFHSYYVIKFFLGCISALYSTKPNLLGMQNPVLNIDLNAGSQINDLTRWVTFARLRLYYILHR